MSWNHKPLGSAFFSLLKPSSSHLLLPLRKGFSLSYLLSIRKERNSALPSKYKEPNTRPWMLQEQEGGAGVAFGNTVLVLGKGQQRATGTSHVLRKSEEFSVNGNLGHPLSLHVILREFLFCGVQASARLTLSPCLGSPAQLLLPRCSQSYLHCSTSLTLYLCNWSSRRQWELCNQLPTSQVLGTGLVTLIMRLLGHTE